MIKPKGVCNCGREFSPEENGGLRIRRILKDDQIIYKIKKIDMEHWQKERKDVHVEGEGCLLKMISNDIKMFSPIVLRNISEEELKSMVEQDEREIGLHIVKEK